MAVSFRPIDLHLFCALVFGTTKQRQALKPAGAGATNQALGFEFDMPPRTCPFRGLTKWARRQSAHVTTS